MRGLDACGFSTRKPKTTGGKNKSALLNRAYDLEFEATIAKLQIRVYSYNQTVLKDNRGDKPLEDYKDEICSSEDGAYYPQICAFEYF